MPPQSRKVEWIVWGGLLLIILLISAAFVRQRWQDSSSDASVLFPPTAALVVPAFSLTNQFGKEISNADLQGHVWLANIIFTRCAGACPQMTKNLAELQAALPPESPVRLISLTSDAAFDTTSVLKAYAEKYDAQPDRWWFLTGNKTNIAELAVGGLKLISNEIAPKDRLSPEDLFIHSSILVLVDRKGYIRGTVDSLDNKGWKKKALYAIDQLLGEAP